MTIILDEITSFIGWVWESTPTWLKAAFFVGLIIFITNVFFPIIFMLSGQFCVAGQPYEGSVLKLWDNPKNMFASFSMGDNTTNGTMTVLQGNRLLGVLPTADSCVHNDYFNGSYRWFFFDNSHSDGACSTCVHITYDSAYWNNISENNIGSNYGLCEGDVHNINYSWWASLSCGRWQNDCLPPPNFYYSYTQNQYVCEYPIICGNYTETEVVINNLLA
jgi:hypothetical protein